MVAGHPEIWQIPSEIHMEQQAVLKNSIVPSKMTDFFSDYTLYGMQNL